MALDIRLKSSKTRAYLGALLGQGNRARCLSKRQKVCSDLVSWSMYWAILAKVSNYKIMGLFRRLARTS